ncbi:AraC family transcriptional regulator [Amphritea pacifica]|uniref:AraC family transcriptional regulator n=1 Tax=Amphritea pacifica TaxID=2811233 RepID=A0ABS2WCC8_9GAMM|nr:AraC family transcriptional regulator [Amphritea pacifica]MBN0989017.1 AraC family transcriptional regulator [Amphritea pacifica]MBN1008925.1 AraC family transcriptional regulator [Amphritea pacifica]
MSYNHHSISIHFANAMLKGARANGLNEQQLLREAGLNSELLRNHEVRITPMQLSRLVQSILRHSDDDYLGLASPPCRFGVFAVMCRMVIHCTDLQQVFTQAVHFYNLLVPASHMTITEKEDRVIFTLDLTHPEKDPDHALIDFLLLLWHRFPSWLIGQRIPLKQVGFRHSKPAHFEEYRLMFPCPSVFDQPHNSLTFDRAIMNAPVVQTVQNLSSYLRRAPLDWFKRQSYYPVYTRKVMDYLENAESMVDTSMEDIASQLHTTSRTLRRKLDEEGTSFQEIKDGVRRDEAIHLLSQPNLPISRIARRLGFAEAAAFTRAFKHWTGISPSTYRKSKG